LQIEGKAEKTIGGNITVLNMVACYKWVVDEADIRINQDLSVDMSKAQGKISEYDKNAIEAAVQAAKAAGARAVGLTFGNEKSKPSLKDALSRGLEEGYWVHGDEADTADAVVTAKVLAEAIKRIGNIGLVFCAEGAADTYARQTAPRLGALLDLPVITSAKEISIDGNTVTVTRKLDDCVETVSAEFPAIIAVLPEANVPDIPGLKAVMAASKKPVTEWRAADLITDATPLSWVTSVKGYETNRKNIVFAEGDAAERVKQLVAALRKEGVL